MTRDTAPPRRGHRPSHRGLVSRAPPLLGALAALLSSGPVEAQASWEFLPSASRLPVLLAGAREPALSAALLGVLKNPNRLGRGVEAELSLGHSLPLLRVERSGSSSVFLAGIEAGVHARFGLQILEREMVATDWLFAVPAVWGQEGGWIRFRYYHTSSHLGDEYGRRFGEPGIDFSRDAADLFGYSELAGGVGVYAGVRFGYNVKPESSRRWVIRGGAQKEWPEQGGPLRPYLAADVEWDQDAGDPRVDLRAGAWLPAREGRRSLRWFLGVLAGPTPLGQFQGGRTVQISLGVAGHL